MVQDRHHSRLHGAHLLEGGEDLALSARPRRDQPGRDEFGQFLDIAEVQLSHGAYLAGDAFTLADIQFGQVLLPYFDISITRQGRPALRRYYDSLMTRPAFHEHVTIAYEELRVLD